MNERVTSKVVGVRSLKRLILVGLLSVATVNLSAAGLSTQTEVADSLSSIYRDTRESAEQFDPGSGVESYLAHAALSSPALKAAFYRWRAALEKTGYAGALPDPMLTYGRFIENVETRVGPQEQRIGLKQSFPWFGTLGTSKDIAAQQANAAYEKYESEKLKLFYRVKAAFYEYYFLGANISLTNDNLELLKFWESVARVKYKVALKRYPDVIKAQVELGKLEDRLRTLEDMIAPAAARLRAVANLPDSVDLPLPDSIEAKELTLPRDTVMAAALSNNPDLGALLYLIDKSKASVRLAGKKALPGFTVGVDYIQTGEALNPSLEGSGKDPWLVGVGVRLPLWFGKNAARRREARAQLQAARNNYVDARNRLTSVTERALFEYADALRKTRLYRDGLVPKAEQALNAAYTSYQADETDFLNVLDAQRQLLDFQLKLERAKADLAIHAAEIEMITGLEIHKLSTIDN